MSISTKKLNVCHVLSGDLWAGAEVMAFQLLQCLSISPEIKLRVILLNKGRLAEELQTAGIDVEIIDENKYSLFRIFGAILSSLAADPPNIIHSHRYKENFLAFLATRFLKNTKLVSTQHGLPENQNQSTSLAWKSKSKANFYVLSQHFHKVIAVSTGINVFFIDNLKFNPKKVQTIHNGIENIDGFTNNKITDKFVLGSSGRLFPVKDYSLLVEIASLTTHHENISFTLAGDGPEKVKLEETITQLNLNDSFSLRGHLNDMDSFYANLDVYINTSLHEGIPMTILEAMAHGLPIVAPKVGGIPEIVEDGVEGFLIDSRDPKDYADKCLLLCRDKKLWRKMSIAARKKVCSKFSREQMAERYLECYRELVG